MASVGGLLGVIRSARPSFRSPHDPVAFAVHAAFLAAGYSLTAVGSRADAPQEEQGEVDVGIEGWKELGDAYAFRYAGIDGESCKVIMVKCVAMGDMLMVDVAPLGETNDAKSGEPLHLEIKVTDYVSSRDGSNYGPLYTNFHELVDRLNSLIFSKLSQLKESSCGSTSRVHKDLDEIGGEAMKCSRTGNIFLEDYSQSIGTIMQRCNNLSQHFISGLHH